VGSSCVTKDGESKELGETESMSSQRPFLGKQSAHEWSHAYTFSQLTLSFSSKIAGCLCRLKYSSNQPIFQKINSSYYSYNWSKHSK